ncbi:Gar1/Naf1 RNA binding region-domain-containing protein [Microdochium trichocladiopsis]|uniref:H/ACA ribonucleoprotein complex non-core subunit NAF1 n=1 Tax=Microdochium trichocladiopsis TaxID=1682393 RepID=A0A9P8YA48_9PEZI|nr:Gar1/Naf1 RNA binding region-domain-containing protein [Microdochium trichocladiopsis]KAH7031574.1 Gar1/Naf1 RNA binding region-domain-containing protein [Microdochium trichocladiopsis]
MASNGFQIPGLSTLSGSAATAPATTTAPPTAAPPVSDTITATEDASTLSSVAAQSANEQTSDEMAVDPTPAPNATVSGPEPAADAAPSPPSLTEGLEALLGGIDPEPQDGADTAMTDGQDPAAAGTEAQGEGEEEGEHPEWEEDSSPYESSSSDSSDSDSDDDSDEDGEGNPILGPEETARILMEMEGGSDDEGGKGKGGSAAQLRTKNELAEEMIPKPDLVITEDMRIAELGEIEHVIENTIVIKANTTGEVQVLEPGFPICIADRTVIAAIADVIGSVRQPRYTAMFATDDEVKTLGLEVGTKIFYPPTHAVSVFTQPLRTEKGTDASNWHDEEAGMDEIEFSDDEKEAEYKRQLKAKKKAGRGGSNAAQGSRQDGASASAGAASGGGLNYDDNDEDGPYRKLTRPSTFGQGGSGSLDEVNTAGSAFPRGGHRGGRGDSRGRGGRGRGGDRGGRGGRGGQAGGSGHSLPPRPPPAQSFGNNAQQQQQPQQQPFNFIPPSPFGNQVFPPPPPPPQFQAGQQQQQPVMPPFPFPAWPQAGTQSFVPPPPPPPGQFAGQSGAAASGAYYNPAFLAALQVQLQQKQQQEQQGQSHHQNPSHPQWPGQGHPG